MSQYAVYHYILTLAWVVSAVRHCTTPSIIQLLLVSPGCTRDDITTPFRHDRTSGGAGSKVAIVNTNYGTTPPEGGELGHAGYTI